MVQDHLDGFLGLTGCGDNEALVVAKNLQLILNVSGVVAEAVGSL